MALYVNNILYNCLNSLPYKSYVGGVFAINKNHFTQINGFSNLYWGWGGEDDEFEKR